MRVVTVTAALVVACACAVAQEPKKEPPKREQGKLKIGDVAPGFELADVDGKKKVKLADLKGKPVVLVFGSCT
ncbi:MAG: redoxin domain-containing protein [Planctomycetes bacterium]|nr:redoxin domain-containing protein [Planctomycetota bacterium]